MNPSFLKRALEALVQAYEWYGALCRRLGVDPSMLTNILLTANFLSLRQLVEAGKSGETFDIEGYKLEHDQPATLIADVAKNGRAREIAVWVDSAVGAPDPTIRISTDAARAVAGGIRVKPGDVNELGAVPPNTRLYAASDIDITLYVIERS